MSILIVQQPDVPPLLPMSECIEIMEDALKTLARGNTLMPLRGHLWLPENVGELCMMPAYLGHIGVLGLKVITYFPGNWGTEFDTHQGGVMLYEEKHGCLLAIIDASEITAIRTAAVTAVATRPLAREDASDLAILGSGTQARVHLESMLLARSIHSVRVWSIPLEQAAEFAEVKSKRHGIPVQAMSTAAECVDGADIICTNTSAKEPVLKGDWISPGTHVNAVGSTIPHTRELDTRAVLISKMFCDRRESCLKEAGDFLFPKKEGAIGDDHIQGEIGDILIGKIKGRESDSEITMFKSLGLAIEDVAAAYHVYKKAKEQGVGTWVDLGGKRHTAG